MPEQVQMERVEVETDDRGTVAFRGRSIAGAAAEGGDVEVFETAQHRIAAYASGGPGGMRLVDYDTFDDFAEEWTKWQPRMVAVVAETLGERHVTELDI